MKFPSLAEIVKYDVYTIKNLEKYENGTRRIKNMNVNKNCEKCAFVHSCNSLCSNCQS